MYHVKATPFPPLNGLDLELAEKDDFSPDKLRANVERLYMTVIVGMIGFGKHIARLRSWREPRRTGAFAAVGTIARQRGLQLTGDRFICSDGSSIFWFQYFLQL